MTDKSRLLYVKRPLVLNPELAKVLNSGDLAITLQQVEYWIGKTDNVHMGHKWVYNSIPQWAKQFPWSESTTKRNFAKLRKMKLLLTGHFGKTVTDRTLWYRINYAELDRLAELAALSSKVENASGQNDPMEQVKMTRSIRSKWPDVKKEPKAENSSHRLQADKHLNGNGKNAAAVEGADIFQDQIPKHLQPYHDKLLDLWGSHLRMPSTKTHLKQWTHGLLYIREVCETRDAGLGVLDRAFKEKGWAGMDLTDGHSLRVWLSAAEAEIWKEQQPT